LKDRAQHLPSLLPGIRPWTITAREAQKKIKKSSKRWRNFQREFSVVFYHVFTTIPPRFTTQITTFAHRNSQKPL
jgi:hypothetical protein